MYLETVNKTSAKAAGAGKNASKAAAGNMRPTPLMWIAVVVALIVGLLVGALIMRQRAKAHQVMVSVNGTVITRDAFFNRLQQVAGMATMHKMVEEELQIQFAQKKGLAPTDAEVNAKYAQASRQPNFDQILAANGQTRDSYKHGLRVKMAQTAVLVHGVNVSEADMRSYYKSQINPQNPQAQFYRPETIVLRAIATASRQDAARAMQDLARSTPFELVAQSYSRDASKTNGGLLNPIGRGRSDLRKVPAVENAVFALKVGGQLGPVALGKQWWIFRCEEKMPPTTLPYQKVRDDCRTGAQLVKGVARNGRTIEAEFQKFERTSNLQAFWPQYQPALGNK